MTAPDLALRLEQGLDRLGLAHSPDAVGRLLAFLSVLEKWNKRFSLTAIRDAASAVDLHLLDSLTLLPYLHGSRILDVGTGAGLPGIPLAVMAPTRRFVLLDSNGRKTRFVQQAVIELGLANVEVVTSRVEDYRPTEGFDTILTRAFASLGEIQAKSARLLAPGGKILAQKGRWPEAEIGAFGDASLRVHRLHIPGRDAERHLVEIGISRET